MATQHKACLSLDKKDIVLVKPAEATPQHVLSLSTMDNNPHLELLCQSFHVYESNHPVAGIDSLSLLEVETRPNNNLSSSSDPASVIKEALSRVLVYYYPLAGKIKRNDDGKLQITCHPEDGAVGVPFLEATADSDLSSFNNFEEMDSDTAKSLIFNYTPADADINGYYHLLVMQVTKFTCGGFTIGIGLSHSVGDGYFFSQFFQAMAELASGLIKPSVIPVWERDIIRGRVSRNPIIFPTEYLVTSPYLPTTEMVHEWINVGRESISKLKMMCLSQQTSPELEPPLTSLEILGAYVWRARFRALEQNPDGITKFMLVVGVRHVINNPPLPKGYYGNAIVASQVGLTGKELDEGPLYRVAKLIKQCKKTGTSVGFVKDSVDFLETAREQKVPVVLSGATMVLTDCRQLGFLEVVDFGWKKPVNVISLPWSMFGFIDSCIFCPPNPGNAGGVKVLMSLPRGAMPKFKEEMKKLKGLS